MLAGASTGNDYPFLEGLYAAGAGDTFDGVASHTDTACLITPPDIYYREDGRVGRFSFLGFRETHAVLAAHGHARQADHPVGDRLVGDARRRCARGANAGKKAAGVSEAQQAAYLKLAYRCLRPTRTCARRSGSARATSPPRTPSSAATACCATTARTARPGTRCSASCAAARPPAACGDFTAPRVSVHAPTANAVYDRSLLIRVAAHDDDSKLGRITLYAGGRKIRSFTEGLRNGRPVEIEWMGARELPYGPVNVTVEALDEFGNTTRQDIPVTRVEPGVDAGAGAEGRAEAHRQGPEAQRPRPRRRARARRSSPAARS